MLVQLALYGVLIPALVAGVIVVVAGRAWRTEGSAPAIVGPGLAAGFVAGYWGLLGAPAAIPIDVTGWLPHLAVLAAVACAVENGISSRAVHWAGRLVVSLVTAWLLLRPLAGSSWTTGQAMVTTAGFGLVLLATWYFIARAATGEHRLVGVGLAILLAASTAAAVAASGSLLVGQLTGAMAAGLGALFVAMLVFAAIPTADKAAGVVAIVTGGAAILGFAYSQLPVVSLLLLAIVIPAYMAVCTVIGDRLASRLATAIRLGVAAVIAAAAIGLAAMPPAADGGSGDDYDYAYGDDS
ncbi:MAG: hypothetical protein MJE77_13435 [Proteobacteria bacterium]|nr:hypothetical protein [Pseudomonadota bacterium]